MLFMYHRDSWVLQDLIQKENINKFTNFKVVKNLFMLAGICSDFVSGPFHIFGSSVSSQFCNLKGKADF